MTEFYALSNNSGTTRELDVNGGSLDERGPPKPNNNEVRDTLRRRMGNVTYELRTFNPKVEANRAEGSNINRAGDIDRDYGRAGQIALVVTGFDSANVPSDQMIIFDSAEDAWKFVSDILSKIGENPIIFNEYGSLQIGRTIEGIKQQAEIEALTSNIKKDLGTLDPGILPREMKVFSSGSDAAGYALYQNQKGENKRASGESGEVSIVVRIENGEVSRSAVFTFSSAAKAEAFVASAPKNQDSFEDIAFDVDLSKQAGVKLGSMDDLVIEELRQPIKIAESHNGDIIHVGLPLSDSVKTVRANFFEERNEDISDRWEKDYLIELSGPQGSVLAVVNVNDLANIKADAEAVGLNFELIGPEPPR